MIETPSTATGFARRIVAALLVLGIAGATRVDAQIPPNVPFTNTFSVNQKGDIYIIGNTNMTCVASSVCAQVQNGTSTLGGSGINNNGYVMTNVNVDPDGGTNFNSSRADFALPQAAALVTKAFLYWGGVSSNAARGSVRLKVPGAAGYATVNGAVIGSGTFSTNPGPVYHAFADVTSLIPSGAGAAGQYFIGNIQTTPNLTGNYFGAWSLVFVMRDTTQSLRNLQVFHGFLAVNTAGGVTIPLSGLSTPPTGTVNARVGVVSYEGDRGTTTEGLRLNSTVLSDPLNPTNNQFNSTITRLGTRISTKLPDYVNQLGFDIDVFNANGAVPNLATSANVTVFGSGSENYYPGVITTAIDVFVPNLISVKSQQDLNGGTLGGNDVIEYSIQISNENTLQPNTLDDAANTLFTDPIPAGLTYVPNSLQISGLPNPTDASGDDTAEFDSANNRVVFRLGTGANASQGGVLLKNTSVTVKFRVLVPSTVSTGQSFLNQGLATAVGLNSGQLFSAPTDVDAAPPEDPTPITITGQPDLTVTKAAIGTFQQGGPASYQITVTNSGGAITSGLVTMTDTLPAAFTATSASGTGWSCSIANPTVTCTRSNTLGAAASYPVVTIDGALSGVAPASVANTAQVSGGGDSNPGNNSVTINTPVTQVPSLAVSKTHTGNFAQGQTGATYTITVSNNGGATTSGTVTAIDTLPGGLTATAISGTGWACVLVTLTCSRADALSAASSYPPITLTVNVATNAGSPLVNSVSLTGGGSAPAGTTDSTIITATPDLTITKTHSGNFAQGQTGAVYTITVSNAGGGATTGTVTVTDTLPAGLTASAIAGTGWSCTLGTLTCTRSDALAAAASYPSISLTVNVAPNAGSPLSNSVSVSGGGETNTGNNTATDLTTILASPDLTIAKSHTGSFVQGQSGAAYTIAVTNSGNAPTSGTVSVTDVLPAGFTATGLSGTGWTCSTGTLTCTRADALAAGQGYPVITLTVSVSASASSPLVNVATVSGGGETVTSNNSASDSTVVDPAPDLTISKTHAGNFTQGQTGAVYTITVSNLGTTATSGTVTVTDTLPAGLSATAISGAGWTCTLLTLSCSRSDSLAGATAFPAITLTVDVAANTAPSVTNTAAVAGGGDTTPGNNSTGDLTTVIGVPDLSITKTHSGGFAQGQTGATYTVAVSNLSATSTTGTVTVVETPPSGLTVTALAGTGWTCVLGTLTCTRSDTLTGTSSFPALTVTVDVSPLAPASVTNSVTVSGGGDTSPSNNTANDLTAIGSVPDLSITKTHSGNFTQGQTGATYSLTVSNNGGATSSGAVTVTDIVPAGLTLTGLAGTGWTCSVGTASCSRSNALPTGQSYPAITVTVSVSNTAAASVTNTATVSGGGDTTPGNNSASDPTVITPNSDLTISKTHTGNFAQGQTGAQYSITVSNIGGGASSGLVTVTDTIPAGLTLTGASGTNWSCTTTPADFTCTRSDALPQGTPYPAITLTVNVAGNAPSNVTNTAAVSGGGDITPANNASSDPTTIGGTPDLTITKSHSGNFTQGQTGATYSLTVTNSGGTATSGTVTVTDTLPAGLTATAMTGTGWSCVLGTLTCTRNDALAAGTGYPAITLTVDVSLTTNASVTNTATVAGGGELNTTNNSSSDATTVVPVPDLTISKSHAGNFTQGQTGAQFSLVVSVVNAATSGTVSVTDTLPSDLSATSASGPGWACTINNPQSVSCTRSDSLPAGSSYAAITLTANVALNAAASIVNTATVSGGGDITPGNNSAADTAVVIGVPNLGISKTHTGNFTQGQTGAQYVLTVSNTGGAPTSGLVTVTDTLPAGLTATAAAGAGWTCTLSPLSCTRNDALSGGSSYPAIAFTVDVAANAGASLTNTATVTGGGDTSPANNTASDPTTVTPAPDLTLAKTHAGSFQQGQTNAAYTLSVSNAGSAATTGTVTVTDTLPADLVPVGATGSGWNCTVTGQTVTCTRADALGAGLSYPAITITSSVSPTAGASVTNTASVSGGGQLNTANDTDSDVTTINPVADLSITKTHAGNFAQGQVNAAYTVTVSNIGLAPTNGTSVAAIDNLPSGLVPTAATGTGWSCTIQSQQSVNCNRSDILGAGQSWPPITITASVSPTAPSGVVNSVTVSGGGDVTPGNNTAADNTTIDAAPDLTITKTHSGSFAQNQTGASYTISVSNVNAAPTFGPVAVSDTLPAGLTATGITGAGWTCTLAPLGCSRIDSLPANSTYPPILLTVNVAGNAPGSVTNVATVNGGGDSNPGNNTATDVTAIGAVPDLTITKTHGGNFAQGQANAQYTLTVTNNGGAGTTGTVTVTDTLPSGLTASAIAGTGWSCTLATLACNRADVLPPASSYPDIVITVGVSTTAAATVTNVASVSGGGDTTPANNSASDPTTIDPFPDLTITKSHTGNFTQGQTGAAFQLLVGNIGGAASFGTVQVTDTLPAGLTPVLAGGSGWGCTIAGQTVTCTRSDALPGTSSYPPVALTVNVATTAASTVNTAAVSGGGDVNAANNTATDPVTIGSVPDLTIAKTHAGNFTQGQSGATYSLTVSNSGGAATTGLVTVSDTLPAGLTFVSAAGTGWTCTTGQAFRCNRSDALAPGGSYPAVTLTVNVTLTAPPTLTNTATVSGGGDVTPGSNSASDVTTVNQVPDLTISKSHSGNFQQGQTGATYTVTVSNTGSSPTTGLVSIQDTVPLGLTPVSATGTGWSCTVTAPNVTCSRSDVLSGVQSYPPVTLTVNVASNAPASLTNTATVSGGGDVSPANNGASDVTLINASPDLTITKTHSGSFTQGQIGAAYTITVSNLSGAATTGPVTVADPVPAGLTPTSASGTGWGCTIASPNVTCTRADSLSIGLSYPAITVLVNVSPSAPASITNTASVSGGGDATPTNNSDANLTAINPAPDLTIAKSHIGTFTQGQTGAMYTIAVANSGFAATSGLVTVTDSLPAGLTPTAATGTGWNCSVAGQNVSCSRTDALVPASSYPPLTLSVNVSPTAPASVTNTAVVSGGGDSNSANNSAADLTTIGGSPDLALTKTHAGNFTQGQIGAIYVVTVSNTGSAPTNGTSVTTIDSLPTGLTPTAASGTGWACSITAGQTANCTRSDTLNPAQSWPPITITVNVAPNAPASTGNTVSLSGGGDVTPGNNSTTDATTVNPAPDPTITMTHTGGFAQGQTGATYSIAVSNVNAAPTSGTVTVTATLPAGLTPTLGAGTGWTCAVAGQVLTCDRADALPGSGAYPVITLTVNVAPNAASTLTATATVSGGGDVNPANNDASDLTVIGAVPDLTITKTHTGNFTQGQTGASYVVTASNNGGAPTSGTVSVTDTLPSGLTPTAASGTGWSCSVTGQTVSCTRSDVLNSGFAYPQITITLNVASNAPVGVTNTVSVSGGGDSSPGNNSDSDATTIVAAPDLTITKSHTGNFTQGQAGAIYTLTVSNNGGAQGSGTVTVTDTVPAGLTPVQGTGSGWNCSIGGQTVTCSRADGLASGSAYPPVSLEVNVAVNAPASVTNTATVSGGGDSNAANNSSSDPTVISAVPDLTITKTHTGNFTQGQNGAAYSIAVSNNGGASTLGQVTVIDTVPAALTLTAAAGTGWSCTVAAPTATCVRSDALAVNGAYPAIALTVNVAANAPASVTNTASVSGGGDTNTANNTASDLTVIGAVSDLTITKSHTGNFTQGQANATYSLTVDNVGSGPTSGAVTVTDTLPAGLTLVSASGTGWSCTGGGSTATCSRSDALAPGSGYPLITLVVSVASSAAPSVTNTAAVTGGGDVTPGNNSSSDPTTIVATPDLTVAKTHSGTFSQGQAGAAFSITVTNSGGSATTGTVTVTDPLPASLTPTVAGGTGWACSLGGQTVTCTRSDALNPGNSYPPVTISVNVSSGAPATVSNSASVAGGGEINTANNSATDTVSVTASPDLTLSKTAAGAFNQGQTGTFTLSVSNPGTAASTGVVLVTDALPAGLTPVSVSGAGWACAISAQTVTCTRSDVAVAGGTYPPITLTVSINPGAPSLITNSATVSGGGDTAPANNTATAQVAIGGVSDLTITKTHPGNFTQGQGSATYSIIVTNVGSIPTTGGTTVSDAIPAGLTPVSAAGGGWSCTIGGQNVSCTRSDTLTAGASYPAITLSVDVSATAPASVVNTVVVSGGGDINTGNNSSSDSTSIAGTADLTVTKSHSGNFTQGQSGAAYIVTVSNTGAAPTNGSTVAAIDSIPAGLTPTAAAGGGWTCSVSGQAVNCSRSDVLGAGSSYPPISITVDVAPNAAASLTNTVSVTGGGDSTPLNNTASDLTNIVPATDLTITLSHSGTFAPSQTGAPFTIAVQNPSGAPTNGTAVTVTGTLPAALTPAGATGNGWVCGVAGQSFTCTRSDVLPAGGSYPPITLLTDVSATPPSSVTASVSVSGGGNSNTANDTATDVVAIGTVPDLTMTKTHGGTFSQGQSGAIFIVTVTNNGSAPTSGTVTLTDTLPTGLTPAAAAGAGWTCTIAAGTVTCDRADALAAGASYPAVAITVDVAPNAAASLTNTATVSGGGDTTLANNSASDTAVVNTAPDLTISKSHSGNFVQGQSNAVYTLIVSNIGSAPTSGPVGITDAVPSGMTAVVASGLGWTCTISGQIVNCDRSDVLASGVAYPAINVGVNVSGTAPASLTNTATVAGGQDITPANNVAIDPTTVIGSPDLTIAKTHSGSFAQGQTGASYTLTVTNTGAADTAGSITVSDVVPAGLTPTSASGAGWTCSISGQTVTCSRADVLAAGNAHPPMTLLVDVSSTVAASVTNTAAVSGGGDITPANNNAVDPTAIGAVPDLTITLSHSGQISQGQSGAPFTILVANNGGAATTGTVTVVAALPAGLSPASASGNGWSCSISGQTITCTRPDSLPAGSTYPSIDFTVNVGPTVTGILNATATVSGGGDANPANNVDADPISVSAAPDLTLTKTHSGQFSAGQPASYILTVQNVGISPTAGPVTVSDTVPPEVIPLIASGSGWICGISGQTVSCTRSDTLAPASSHPPITINVDVVSGATGVIVNTASVSGGGETNGANNTASDSTALGNVPDLTITKTHSGNFGPGQTGAQYTVAVSNVGGGPTSGPVTVVDTVPAGLVAAGAVGAGWSCTVSGSTITCTRTDVLASGAAWPAIILTVNVAPNAPAAVTNTVTVSGGGDANAANDSSSDLTLIGGSPDLTISKSHSGTFLPGPPGSSYLLVVRNAGTIATSGAITVTDAIPAGLTPVSAAGGGWNCSISGGTVTCTRGDALAAGSSYPAIVIAVNVSPNPPTIITNTAMVAGGGDSNPGNNSANDTVTFTTITPDLTITKTHTGNFTPGLMGAVFTIGVGNAGGQPTSGTVTVSDNLPASLTPVAASGTGWTCSIAGQSVTCTRSDAAAPGASYPHITVTVNVSSAPPASITNTAAVSGGGDTSPGNNSASDTVLIDGTVDLTVAKSHSGNFTRGSSGTYTVVVRNSGGAASSGTATVTDNVPAGLTPRSASGSGWACQISGQTVTCSRNDALSPGTAYPPISIVVDVQATAPDSIVNTASVTGGGDNTPANNSSPDSTSVVNAPDLTISKSHTGDFAQGGSGSYTLTVRNIGAASTSGAVTVADTLPAGLAATAATGSGWTCSVQTSTVSCSRNDALAPDSVWPPITLTVAVAPDAPLNVTNTATVEGGGQVNTGNDSTTDPTTIIALPTPSLRITKTVDRQFVQIGDILTYRIEVSNPGRQSVLNTVVKDQPAPALRYVAGSGRVEASDGERRSIDPRVSGNALEFAVGRLDPGASVTIVYRMRLGAGARSSRELLNTASASGISSGASGQAVASTVSQTAVSVVDGVFSTEQIILGRVFEDRNTNGRFDDGDRGVPGARLYLPNGQGVVTDPLGLYSIPSVAEGSTAISLDPVTVPEGLVPDDDGQLQGRSWTRLLRTPLGAGSMLRQNFALVPSVLNSSPAMSHAAAAAAPGTTVEATSRIAGNTRQTGSTGVARLSVTTGKTELTADGRDATLVRIRAFDPEGRPLSSGRIVIETTAGQLSPMAASSAAADVPVLIARGADASDGDSAEQVGANLRQQVLELTDEETVVRLLSEPAAGPATVRVYTESVEAVTSVEFVPEQRPAMMVGLAEIHIGRATPDSHFSGSTFGGSETTRGYTNVFYRGPFFVPKNVLTASYDSHRQLNRSNGRDRLFQLDPLDRLYPVFGDSSTRYETAQSNSKLFVRLERGRSFAMFGDIAGDTAAQPGSLAAYQRQLTGVKLHIEDRNGSFLSLTGARPDTMFARDVLPGNTFGLTRLSRMNVVPGSETLTVEVRDRRNPERIVTRETLVRSADYNVDWLTGTVFFLRPFTALDEALNLTQIVISYEYRVAGMNSNVYGGRGLWHFQSAGLKVGASLTAQHQDQFGNYNLGGIHAEKALPRGGWLKLEAPFSSGQAVAAGTFNLAGLPEVNRRGSRGYAYRLDLEQPLGSGWGLIRGEFGWTHQDFANPYGSTAVPGSERESVALDATPFTGSKLRVGYGRERNKTSNLDNTRHTWSAFWNQSLGRVVSAGVGIDARQLNQTGTPDIRSALATGLIDFKFHDRVTASVRREQNFTDADPTYPDQTTIGGSVRINEGTRIFLTQRLASAPIVPIADLSATGFFGIQSRRETHIGIEGKWRKHTSFGTRYQLENGINGTDSFAVIGLVNRIPVHKSFAVDLGLERGVHIAGRGQSFISSSVGAAWQPSDRLKSSARYEWRVRDGSGGILSLGLAGRISHAATALGNLQWARTSVGGADNRAAGGSLGLAIRPLRSDRAGVLFSYTNRTFSQQIASTFGGTTGSYRPLTSYRPLANQFTSSDPLWERVDVLSTDGYVQAARTLELFGKVAYSNRGTEFPELGRLRTGTLLLQGRGQYRFLKVLDGALEGRLIRQAASDTRRGTAAAEAGLWPLRDLRLSIGYHFQSEPAIERGFLQAPVRKGFYFSMSSKLSNLFDLFGPAAPKSQTRDKD